MDIMYVNRDIINGYVVDCLINGIIDLKVNGVYVKEGYYTFGMENVLCVNGSVKVILERVFVIGGVGYFGLMLVS